MGLGACAFGMIFAALFLCTWIVGMAAEFLSIGLLVFDYFPLRRFGIGYRLEIVCPRLDLSPIFR